jgi:hypothetical protein
MLLTYEQQKELVNQKLATVKTNGNLDTFKYARRVMFDYLWDTNANLLECRGHTYDNQTGELVVAAPRKSFNYLENGWWKDVPLDTPVIAYKKYNGFMACVSRNGFDVVVSTTGSTNSDFVKMAKDTLGDFNWLSEGNTLLFEIVHENDPHIVDDPIGPHYLGFREKTSGHFEPYGKAGTYVGTLKGILAIAEVNQGEGFMVYDLHNDPEHLKPAKVKTPYYVGKKKLMRAGPKAVEAMYADPRGYEFNHLPKMYTGVAQKITSIYGKQFWLEMDAQDRRKVIEVFV